METFKVGDRVFERSRGNIFRTNIERETKTLFVTASGGRYKKEDGKAVGCDWYTPPSIHPWTQEEDDAFELLKANKKADKVLCAPDSSVMLKALSIETKNKIIELINSDTSTQ